MSLLEEVPHPRRAEGRLYKLKHVLLFSNCRIGLARHASRCHKNVNRQPAAAEPRNSVGKPIMSITSTRVSTQHIDANQVRISTGSGRDRRKIGGAAASWVFSRSFSDRGWMRGLDVEVGESRG